LQGKFLDQTINKIWMSLISHSKNYSLDSNDKTQMDSCKRKLNLNTLESMKYLTGLTDTSDNPTGHCLMKSNPRHNNTLSASSALQVMPFAALKISLLSGLSTLPLNSMK
jgi:hypothetical protein